MKNAWCAIFLICALSGCKEWQTSQQPQQPQRPPVVEHQRVVHTFEPLPYTGGNLAFDRTTGQKCRTWDWMCGCYSAILHDFNSKTAHLDHDSSAYLQLSLREDKDLDKCDDSVVNGMRCEDAKDLPTCESLQKETN